MSPYSARLRAGDTRTRSVSEGLFRGPQLPHCKEAPPISPISLISQSILIRACVLSCCRAVVRVAGAGGGPRTSRSRAARPPCESCARPSLSSRFVFGVCRKTRNGAATQEPGSHAVAVELAHPVSTPNITRLWTRGMAQRVRARRPTPARHCIASPVHAGVGLRDG